MPPTPPRFPANRQIVSDDRSKWLPSYPDPAPGEWVKYDHGMSCRGWHLDCGAMFHADVYANAGQYSLTLNMHPIAKAADPETLMRTAERHIIARVRKMLPAYRVIFARARASADFQPDTSNIGTTR